MPQLPNFWRLGTRKYSYISCHFIRQNNDFAIIFFWNMKRCINVVDFNEYIFYHGLGCSPNLLHKP